MSWRTHWKHRHIAAGRPGEYREHTAASTSCRTHGVTGTHQPARPGEYTGATGTQWPSVLENTQGAQAQSNRHVLKKTRGHKHIPAGVSWRTHGSQAHTSRRILENTREVTGTQQPGSWRTQKTHSIRPVLENTRGAQAHSSQCVLENTENTHQPECSGGPCRLPPSVLTPTLLVHSHWVRRCWMQGPPGLPPL